MSGWAPVGAVNHAKIKGERMRAVVQRVSQASVSVDGVCTGAIGPGLLVLACIESGDGEAELAWMARKLVQLRIFADAHGAMNRSLLDVNGELLAISQFGLAIAAFNTSQHQQTRANGPGTHAIDTDRSLTHPLHHCAHALTFDFCMIHRANWRPA
jgi:D-tyrosyl-tRNA(Tyr) deacylase